MTNKLIILLFLLIPCSWAHAQINPGANNILYVDENVSASSDSGGGSWGNAIPELADALEYAKLQDNYTSGNPLKIFVAIGTYNPFIIDYNDPYYIEDKAFLMVKNVQLYGGFDPANNIVDLADSRILPDTTMPEGGTILSGLIEDTVNVITRNMSHVVLSIGDVGIAKLDGFTVTGGKADKSSYTSINGESINNSYGGGIYNKSSSLSLTNLVVCGNSAESGGGGIANFSSSPSLSNVIMSGNSVPHGDGGGMANYSSSSPSLFNVTMSGNSVIRYGGGMYNHHSSPNLANVTISENTTPLAGGGMYNSGASPSLVNVFIGGNIAVSGGGMVNRKSASSQPSLPILTNVTISGNTASQASGMENHDTSTPSLYNSIVYGNISTKSYKNEFLSFDESSPIVENSLVQGIDNTPNNGLNGTNPDRIFFNDPENGDYSLINTSLAVNAGSNTAYTNAGGNLATDVDLAGNPRLYEGASVNDNIDIGAYELQAEPLWTVPDANNIIYVDKNATGNGLGGSWDNAFTELDDALVWARWNESRWSADIDSLQIFVAIGTYNPLYSPEDGNYYIDDGRKNAFFLVNNVQLYGGFDPANNIKTLADKRIFPDAGSGTILSGDINGDDGDDFTNNSENTYRLMVSYGEIGSARLDGFTITGGNADELSNAGGYLFTIINDDSLESHVGGGMYNYESSPSLVNVSVSGNSTYFYGGGIFNYSSSPNLINVSLSGNTANFGGGMYNKSSSSPSLTNVTISGNTVNNSGGGIYNKSSSLSLHNSIIYGNNSYSLSAGGIIDNSGSTSSIDYSLVQGIDNTANNGLDGTNENLAIFKDSANGDYNLMNNSPAIGAGSNAAYTTAGGDLQNDKDLAGNPRLQNASIDMGAYESPYDSPITENEQLDEVPNKMELKQNYPNPFNPTTNIRYSIKSTTSVSLEVFNMLGQKIATLVNGKQTAGWHTVTFDATGLSSGFYLYRIQAGDFMSTKKLMLIK